MYQIILIYNFISVYVIESNKVNLITKAIEIQPNHGFVNENCTFIGFKYSRFAWSLNKEYFVYFKIGL